MIYLNELGIICPLGNSRDEIRSNMLDSVKSGVTLSGNYGEIPLPLGKVALSFSSSDPLLPIEDRSRNNQLALLALAQIRPAVDAMIERFGKDRIGVVIGTSTSGIAESENAIQQFTDRKEFPETFHYSQQELGSLAHSLACILEVSGPVYVHSNACASGAKAIASAARLIEMNVCDAVISGGVDTLSSFVIAGFSSLESVSSTRCNPFSANRNGINLGEGAALFLMSREPSTVSLAGWGESSDGYHISAPDPKGNGATRAIRKSLSHAGIKASQLDYINLHGTGTIQNDAMESRVIHDLVGDKVAVSSTKPLTGHALGAAGAIEAGLCWLAMQDNNSTGKIPPHLWDGNPDPSLPLIHIPEPDYRLGHPIRYCLSNSFAFGGSNATLLFGRE